MARVTSEAAAQLNPPLSDVSPPEPESFLQAARLQAAVQEELAVILASPSFRTSKKSSEFFQYVVQVALDGRTDSLKERSIGLDLLGRDVSYDPSSDATVRVRANEVRKRLASFYSSHSPATGYRIELWPGSYTPRFVQSPKPLDTVESLRLNAEVKSQKTEVAERRFAIEPFNTLKMIRPALVALFFCALFLRQQIQVGDPYHQFWDKRLRGRAVMLLSLEGVSDPDAKSNNMTQAILPIIWLAGRYNLNPVVQPHEVENNNKQGAIEGDAVTIRSVETTPPPLETDKRLRYQISASQGSFHLVNQLHPLPVSAQEHAAVLTVLPEHPSMLWIVGTDWKTVSKLTAMISSKNKFPTQLNIESEAGRVVQVVLRDESTQNLEFYTHQP
jgi:hypothetical protein